MGRVATSLQVICVAILLSSACDTRGDARPLPPDQENRQASGGIAWFHDLFEAHKVSLETSRPMLIVFGADWCHYCKEMEAKTLRDKKLCAYVTSNFIPVHLDKDRDARVAEILKIKSIPCTIILSPNADLAIRLLGYQDVLQYQGELEKARVRYLKSLHRK